MNKKRILIVLTLLFVFMIVPMFSNNQNIENVDVMLKTSTDNYIFNGKDYTFDITDVYDDENLTKTYTGANFQTVFLENDTTTLSEEVSPVNNSNYKSPSNTGVTMNVGTFDDTDNMKINDDSYSEFDSPVELGHYPATYSFRDEQDGTSDTDIDGVRSMNDGVSALIIADHLGHKKVMNIDWIDAIRYYKLYFDYLTQTSGTIETWIKLASDETENFQWQFMSNLNGYMTYITIYDGSVNIGHDGGYTTKTVDTTSNWFHLKIQFDFSTHKISVWINGELIVDDLLMVVPTGTYFYRHRIQINTVNAGNLFIDALGYSWDPEYNIGDNENPLDSELDFTIDLNFNEVDTSKLLAFDVSSFHYTDISQTIIGNVYDYDSSSYTEMFSSSNTGETLNYFSDESSVSDYLNGSGNLRLQFRGTNSESDFKLSIDYIEVRFYYKMDLTHTISFETNGLWKYRWELIGSLQYTDWTFFEVVDPVPNFHAISESDITTRWILQNATAVPLEDFNDNITINSWNLEDVSQETFIESTEGGYLEDNISFYSPLWEYTGTYQNTQSEDTYAMDLEHNNNTWYVLGYNNLRIYEYYENWTYKGISHDISSEDIYPLGIHYYDGYWYIAGYEHARVFKYYANWTYTGSSYDVSSGGAYAFHAECIFRQGDYWYVGHVFSATEIIFKFDDTWTYVSQYDVSEQGGMSDILYINDYWYFKDGNTIRKYNSTFEYTGTSYDVPESFISQGMTIYNGFGYIADAYSEESYNIRIYDNIAQFSKIFHNNESGYVYMQTNITELISIKSIDYTNHYNLSSGDYFGIDFQTSSDNQIDLVLLKDGEVQKTLTLSQFGNTNFGRHTAQISVSEELEFDQLKISSTFEDTDYIKIYDIKSFKYTIEEGESTDFYVAPNNYRDIYIAPSDYNLRIFEESTKKIDTNATITSSDYWYIYQPTASFQCRLTLHSTEGINLDITDFHISVNRSIGGSYSEFSLLDNTFNVDEGTMIYFEVSDRFDNLIDEFQQVASDYIDLELEVYQLQIKNLMEQQTTVDIDGTQTFPVLSGELIEYILSKNYYEIGYYDMDNDYRQFNIYLDSNQAYELNRSKICFLSYADQQGNHLSFDNYKTYINDTMIYEQIFYEDAGDDVNITITDRYDFQVYSGVYSVLSGDNYIPITLTMYSLKVMNQQESFNHINITRDPNYYESEYYWSEWIAPNEIIEFRLFAGYYKINLTDNEGSSYSFYEYTLNGDDFLLISSDNIISNVIYNIANVNTTIGNQITNVQIDLTNQNSDINNTIINIDINLSNVNSSLGTLLTNINLDIININNNISELYTFTENNFLNLGNNINSSFTLIENNIVSINQTISTLVIGLDGKITIVNATINTMFTEMNSQFIVVQSTLDFSFAFLNQTITQIGNNITNNQIALNSLIIQRANDIDNSLIEISTLVNLINSSVVNESLVVQSLVNIIGNNITENHVAINNLINLIGNNITENNVNMINLIELVGNNITTNHFVIQTLIDYVSNNISDNHLELLTNINLINNTIDQNQIELINRLLFINNSINTMALDLTNQILLVNNTIYSAILDVSTSIDFNSDNILGNISLTYQQNDFLTELYKETMFSQLLNWSDVAYNYSLMEDRIDVWDFINNYRNESITVLLKYGEIIDNLTITAQNSIEQYLPNEDVEYRLWNVANEEYLDEWKPLPENRTVPFGFYEEVIPEIPDFNAPNTILMIILIVIACIFPIVIIGYIANRYRKKSELYRKSYADKITLEAQTIKKFSQGRRIR